MAEILSNYLFGPYVLELHKFFTEMFASIQYEEGQEAKTLQCFYGQPRAAFRSMTEKFNGKIVLPMLNFYLTSPQRQRMYEKPGTVLTDLGAFDPATKTIGRTRCPMRYDVTWSCNLWTDGLRDRDYIMHKLMQIMPGGEMTLVYFTNTSVVNGKTVVNDRKQYLLMPLAFEESTFTDETEVEQLEMQQVRDRIKTNFNLIGKTVIAYNVVRVPAIDGITVIHQINGQESTTQEIFTQEDFSV